LLDQLSPYLSKGELELEEALKILNLAALEQVLEFIDILHLNEANRAIEYLSQLEAKGVDFTDFAGMLVAELRNELIQKLKLDDDVSWEKNALERLIKAVEQSKSSPLPILPLELAVIDLAQGAPKSVNVKAQKFPPEVPARRQGRDQPIAEKDKTKAIRDPRPVPYAQRPTPSDQSIKDFPRDQRSAIIEAVSHQNKPLGVLLAGAEWALDEKTLCLTVEYQIYKEKIMSKKSLSILHKEIEKVMGTPYALRCEIIAKPSDLTEEIVEVFG
jgi:DNA polymerase III gamma/tau subunit